MRKLRRLRDRTGYGPGHFLQLATSHDFFLDAWGQLSNLEPTALRDVVADMVDCWRSHHVEVIAECQPDAPWFDEYANDPKRLIAEVTADRRYMEEQRRRGGYFPREQMNESQTAAAAPAVAEN